MADHYVPNAGASFFASNTSFEVQRSNHFEIELDLQNLGLSEVNQRYIRLCCTSASIPSIRATSNPRPRVMPAPSPSSWWPTKRHTTWTSTIKTFL